MIHTHTPCITDGTNGVNTNVSDADKTTAGQFPTLKYYAIGCGSIASYNGSSDCYNILKTVNGNDFANAVSSLCGSITY